MATIVLEGVEKRFGTVIALRPTDLVIDPDRRGELFTLVGPSGCGKTTTLRLLAGLERLTGGTIFFDGQPMNGVPPQHRGVGIVFQDYAVFPTMTVYQNAAYGLEMRRLPRQEIDRKVREILQLVDLAHLADRKSHQLSGGQLQRVAVARALVVQPQVLLFDEPLSNLDVGLRVGLRREIRRMQQRLGITTVYVTHDQEEAMAISDRIAVMNQGLVEQIGTPREIYTRPITQFVAQFIGNTVVVDSEVVGRSGPDILVRLGDRVVPVREREAVAIGDRLWVAVRPEDLVLSTPGREVHEDLTGARIPPEVAGTAPLPGTLRHLEDLGNELHGEVAVRGLPRGLRVRLPASGEATGLHVDDPVDVRLNPVTVKYGRG